MQVAFTLSAAAVVAVKATCADKESGLPARDLLVMHPRGGLALYAGARHVCDVSVRAPAAPQAGAVQSLIRSLLPCLPAGEGSEVQCQDCHAIAALMCRLLVRCHAPALRPPFFVRRLMLSSLQ